MSDPSAGDHPPAEKVKTFPTTPGLYLMKDAQGRVIYVGKAKNLRARAGSYFHKTAAEDRRICDWIDEVADIDYLPADSEVDALLMEARLIKDIQPKYNHDLKDDKTFPYLQITTGEDFPRVNFTREPSDSGVKLYGPFPRAKSLRGAIQVLQRIFKFRTCSLDIEEDDPRWRWFRPCLLALDQPVHGPVQPADRPRDLPPRHPPPAALPRRQEGRACSRRWKRRCSEASKALQFEKAARLRDEIKALQNLNLRGDLARHAQPEVFYVDPQKGLKGLKRVLGLDSLPRTIDGVDIAHLGGTRDGRLAGDVRRRPAVQAGLPPVPDQDRAGRRRLRLDPRGDQPPDPGPPGARRAVPRHPPDRRRQGPALRRPGGLRGPQGRSRRR